MGRSCPLFSGQTSGADPYAQMVLLTMLHQRSSRINHQKVVLHRALARLDKIHSASSISRAASTFSSFGIPKPTRLPPEERTGPAHERQWSAIIVPLRCFPSGHPGRFHPDAAARDAIPRLAPGAALIVTLLLSIGFWGASWLAVSTLAAMWPWTVFCAKRKRSRNGRL